MNKPTTMLSNLWRHTVATAQPLSYNYLGLCFALAFFAASVLPSLLPRPWLFQGIISGVSIAVGYGLGALVSTTIRWMTETPWPRKRRTADIAWKVLKVVLPLAFLAGLCLGQYWQNQVRDLVGEPAIGYWYVIPGGVLSVLLALGLVWVGRVVQGLYRRFSNWLDNYIPRRMSIVLSMVVLFLVFMWVVTGVFANFFVSQANRIYSAKNASTPPGVTQPTSPTRSGSPQSLVPWNTVGYQGKNFVARGPSTQQLQAYAGSPDVKEPIRIYAGLSSADTAAARAQMAVAELKRTGAFDRKILVIGNVTGTGWLEPQSVDAIEYMYGGDSAIVAQQYSYLPSWISFLVDKDNATSAGTALFDAVRAEWVKLPADSRPKLITYGLSLGSFGGQAAFSGVNDMRLSVDGALFVGTPNDTRLWHSITDGRDAGTPEWLPVYKKGATVRFAYNDQTITQSQSSWQNPRVLYVQHASDPVVWFDFGLITNKPDWLSEKRGPDVSPNVRWYPFVTFLQVAIDQFFGTTVPNGHGHNYPNVMVDAWASVAAPEGWTSEKATALQKIINTYSNE